MLSHLYLIRHGETAWSLSGQHTSYTDIPLTEKGEADARQLAQRLGSVRFNEVLTSPRLRAQRTCELAGFGSRSKIEPELAEWNYGDYEGLRTAEIHKIRPAWAIFKDGCPGGESSAEITARVDRLIARLRSREGKVAVFAHGHIGRVLAARWIGETVEVGQHLLLSPASVSILAYEHEDPDQPVISLWNDAP
ncbi:MAG TPA: histidine phosphatase family protein [Lacunisphaera sp.]|jgi:probable phosphoglycerate mutase